MGNLEYQKQIYDKNLNIIANRYKKIAKNFFFKGLKAFNSAVTNQKVPNWDTFFDNLWMEFINVKVRCLECGTIRSWTLNLDDVADAQSELDKYINLMCDTCKKLVEIDKWIVIKDD